MIKNCNWIVPSIDSFNNKKIFVQAIFIRSSPIVTQIVYWPFRVLINVVFWIAAISKNISNSIPSRCRRTIFSYKATSFSIVNAVMCSSHERKFKQGCEELKIKSRKLNLKIQNKIKQKKRKNPSLNNFNSQ